MFNTKQEAFEASDLKPLKGIKPRFNSYDVMMQIHNLLTLTWPTP